MKGKLTLTVERDDDDCIRATCEVGGTMTAWEHGRLFAAAVRQLETAIRRAAREYAASGLPAEAAVMLDAVTADLPAGVETANEARIGEAANGR